MRLSGGLGVALCVCAVAQTAWANEPARREGRISVAVGSGEGVTSSADAVFSNTPVWGEVVATDGPCTIRRRLPTTIGLSAGAITISGTASPITLIESVGPRGVTYRHDAAIPHPSYTPGAQITVEAAGGADLPAFTGTVTAPQPLAGYSPPRTLPRSQGYTARWNVVAGSEMAIIIAASDPRTHQALTVVCRVPDTGSFTVPTSVLDRIPRSLDQALVIVTRIAETVQILGDARVMIDAVSSPPPRGRAVDRSRTLEVQSVRHGACAPGPRRA